MDPFNPPSPFPHSHPSSTTPWKWNKYVLGFVFLLWLSVSVGGEEGGGVRGSRDMKFHGMTHGMTPSPITRIHRISNARLNSRFLRTFPSLEFLHMARREGQMVQDNHHHSSHSPFRHPNHAHHQSVDSPVFYIRLPPAPYMFVPGLGYVSPHPYNTPIIPSNPVMMSPFGMMGNGGMDEVDDAGYSSSESPENNLISLPLKFLSNGRPSQIQPPKKKHSNSKHNPPSSDSSKTTQLISGGKYSFNGRPNGVFIVRSPTHGSPNSIM